MNLQSIVPQDFNGAVLARKGDVKDALAFGYSNVVDEVANKLDTKFATASAGKAFVAVGILQLIEQGKITFDSTIGELLDLEWNRIDPNITVAQLLSHTSGIPDYFDESVMDDYAELWADFPSYRIRQTADLLPLFMDKAMLYPAGERFQYNNTGFIVLGLIIEAVTGQKFDQYLQTAVFDVAGMADTGYFELDRLPKNTANNYIWDEEREQFYTNIYSVGAKGVADGGAFTTVLDIEKFWQALLGEKLLQSPMLERMLSRQAGDDEDSYGYGIWLSDSGQPYFEGSDPGVSFFSYYDRNDHLMVAAVSNTGDDVWEIGGEVIEILSA